MIFVIIAILILIPLIILTGMTWSIRDYSEKEKQEIWENFYNQLNK
jgi:hypothetical protein